MLRGVVVGGGVGDGVRAAGVVGGGVWASVGDGVRAVGVVGGGVWTGVRAGVVGGGVAAGVAGWFAGPSGVDGATESVAPWTHCQYTALWR